MVHLWHRKFTPNITQLPKKMGALILQLTQRGIFYLSDAPQNMGYFSFSKKTAIRRTDQCPNAVCDAV